MVEARWPTTQSKGQRVLTLEGAVPLLGRDADTLLERDMVACVAAGKKKWCEKRHGATGNTSIAPAAVAIIPAARHGQHATVVATLRCPGVPRHWHNPVGQLRPAARRRTGAPRIDVATSLAIVSDVE